jgi:hypothetical protein
MTESMFNYPWDVAPTWAQYAATDLNGRPYWFEQEPVRAAETWDKARPTHRCMYIHELGYRHERVSNWKESLQRRPQPKEEATMAIRYAWDLAPHWAQYAVVNRSGTGAWYEKQPIPDFNHNIWTEGAERGYSQLMYENFPHDRAAWEHSLQRRPQPKEETLMSKTSEGVSVEETAAIPFSNLSADEILALSTPNLRRFINIARHWADFAEAEHDERERTS